MIDHMNAQKLPILSLERGITGSRILIYHSRNNKTKTRKHSTRVKKRGRERNSGKSVN